MDNCSNFDLTGKVAIVTGALGLLGKHHCEALTAAGAKVIVTDLDSSECVKFSSSLGDGCLGIGLDVTSKISVTECLNYALSCFDGIDILVNNAAINDMVENPSLQLESSAFENYPLELWQKVIDVNLTGTFLCSQAIGSHMAKRNSGSIINIGSTYGIVAPDQSIYTDKYGQQTFFKSPSYPAAKGAVISLTRFMASYFGKCGVRVNTLSPGGVLNGQDNSFITNYSAKTLIGRMAYASDYSGALVFLSSDASSYMTGANLVVDGGWCAI